MGEAFVSEVVAAPLESELRELVLKLQQSFTQILHPNSTVIGESIEETNGMDDTEAQLEADLAELLEIGGGVAAGGVSGVGGSSTMDKQKQLPPRKPLPVQKVAYSQMQASAMKQAYQTTVNANNLVHHAHSLIGLVSRLKLAVLLAQSAQDRSRQSGSGETTNDPPLPLEAPHPSNIPSHLFPLHLQRTQQQLHQTALELQAQVNEAERQIEDERWKAQHQPQQ